MDSQIVTFDPTRHSAPVIALWTAVFGYESAHNNPRLVLQKKEEARDELFFVAETGAGTILGTVMGGYDGHRGWVYALALSPDHRGQGIGKRLMTRMEEALGDRGCVKINLQIVKGNEEVARFYRGLGYETEERISMGKRITRNIPETAP